MADNPEDRAREILVKADALLGRHRAATAARPAPPVDFPVLTDVVSEAPPPLSDAQLEGLERELRLQLLSLIQPELERLVEARVHERIRLVVSAVMDQTREVLEAEIRRAVREALEQVLTEETERLRSS